MMKKKRTTQNKGTLTVKSAKVPPSQDQLTRDIQILGVGESDDGQRFLKVAVGEKTALLNVDNLADPRSGELKILTRLGEPLITESARRAFRDRAHDHARAKRTFPVVTKTGFLSPELLLRGRRQEFVLPPGLATQGQPNVECYFDPRFGQYHRRLHRAGTIRGWLELTRLCRGQSRLIAALCLAFTGAVCALFGYEPPGLQFVSKGGLGKSTTGRIAVTPWGGSLDPTRRIGCGVSRNHTDLNLEVVMAALNQMLLFLDNMHSAKKESVQKIIELMNGEGRGRSTETQQASFCVPLVSTSNASVVSITRDLGMMDEIEALIDRLADIPLPAGCPYMFEGIRTPQQLRAFGDQLRRLSLNFGWAGPEFGRRLGAAITADRAQIQAFVAERQRAYWRAAASIKSLAGRDLTRISDKFATIYIAGCLAIRFGILPSTEAKLLRALLTCERDHVAFVDRELGLAPTRGTTADGAPTAMPQQPVLPRAGVPATTPYDRLRRFINGNSKRFIDLRKPGMSKLAFSPRHPVYVGEHKGEKEYWFTGDRFAAVTGGEAAFKKELWGEGLLEREKRGERFNYVVKRQFPDGRRAYFVIIRHKRKKPSAPNPTLPC
jgi:putative DNA primase/helicase